MLLLVQATFVGSAGPSLLSWLCCCRWQCCTDTAVCASQLPASHLVMLLALRVGPFSLAVRVQPDIAVLLLLLLLLCCASFPPATPC
jgi:hypothetical protein